MLDLQIGGSDNEPTEEQVRSIVADCQSALETQWNLLRNPKNDEIIPPGFNDPDIGAYLNHLDYATNQAPQIINAHLPQKYWKLVEDLFNDWLPEPSKDTLNF